MGIAVEIEYIYEAILEHMKCKLLLAFILFTGIQVQAQFWTENASGFSNVSRGLSKFSTASDLVTWAVAYDGLNTNNNIQEFSKTTDGGMTWQAGTFTLGDSNLGISNIAAIDATTAYIATYPRLAGQTGKIFKTTDGGLTWTRQGTNTFTASTSFPNIIHFFNATDGVVIGDPAGNFWEIYVTTNAGNTYTRIALSNVPSPLTGETGYIAQFETLGNNIWFTTSRGRLYYSANKGANWTVRTTPITDFGGSNVSGDFAFTSVNQGIIQDQGGNLFTTTNGGTTWNNVIISGTANPYGGAIDYLTGTNQLISTGANASLQGSSYSLDNGTTWTNIDTAQHVDIAVFNATTAYSGSFSTSPTTGGVFKYTAAVLNNPSFSTTSVTAYPNPAKDFIYLNDFNNLTIKSLYDISGKRYTPIINANSLDIKSLATGMYFIEVLVNDNSQLIKFIKE